MGTSQRWAGGFGYELSFLFCCKRGSGRYGESFLLWLLTLLLGMVTHIYSHSWCLPFISCPEAAALPPSLLMLINLMRGTEWGKWGSHPWPEWDQTQQNYRSCTREGTTGSCRGCIEMAALSLHLLSKRHDSPIKQNESMMIVGATLVYWPYLAWKQLENRVMGCLLLWQRFDFCPMRIWTNSLYIVIVHTLANPCCLFLKFP